MIRSVKGGYKVKKENGAGYFSKRPMTREEAEAQLTAINISKARKAGHRIPRQGR